MSEVKGLSLGVEHLPVPPSSLYTWQQPGVRRTSDQYRSCGRRKLLASDMFSEVKNADPVINPVDLWLRACSAPAKSSLSESYYITCITAPPKRLNSSPSITATHVSLSRSDGCHDYCEDTQTVRRVVNMAERISLEGDAMLIQLASNHCGTTQHGIYA